MAGAVRLAALRLCSSARPTRRPSSKTHPCPPTRSSPPPSTTSRARRPNLAPGVHLPAADAWAADRPGDLGAGQPKGDLLGRPGPNVGYALTLADRLRDRLELGPHEPVDDALAVVAELAMKRAASFGRAPMITDVEIAATLLGYLGEVDADVRGVAHRRGARRDHDYGVRRALVDAVPDAVLRLPPKVPALLAEFRGELQQSLAHVERDGAEPCSARGMARGVDRPSSQGPRSRPRRRACCTSAACAPRCSTGCSRATPRRRRHLHPAHRGHRRRRARARSGSIGDPGHAALARSRLGRRPVPPERALRPLPRGGGAPARARATRTSASAPRRDEGAQRSGASRDGRPPGYDGRAATSRADERAAFVAEGRAASMRFRTPDDGRSTSPTSSAARCRSSGRRSPTS